MAVNPCSGAGFSKALLLAVAAAGTAMSTSACANSAPSTARPIDSMAVEDTVLKLEAAMNEAVDALDCRTGLTSLGTRAPAFVSSGLVVRTAPELRDMCERMVSGRRRADFAIDAITAHVLSPDVAYVVREGNYTVEHLDGSAITMYMVMTTIWDREPTGWKMVHLHESIIPPGREPQQATPGQN